MSITAEDWIIVYFIKTVANGFKLEIGKEGEEGGYSETRTFEWEKNQFEPIFVALDLEWRPTDEDKNDPIPLDVCKALAQDAFNQMEKESLIIEPAVADGTTLAELIS